MSELTVSISDKGEIKVLVDGLQVGLIQELTVRASSDRLVPTVEVRLPPSAVIIQSSDGLRESHDRCLELLGRIPAVVIVKEDELVEVDSDIILYFLEKATDGGGRTLSQAIQKDNSWFERTNNYIQWMLPTRRRSRYEPAAPVLTDRDVQVFRVRRDLREAYSFGVDRVKRCLELDQVCPSWVRKKDNRHKRITRLIESLMDLGFEERAKRVLEQVLHIERLNPGVIDPEAVEHWRKAYVH